MARSVLLWLCFVLLSHSLAGGASTAPSLRGEAAFVGAGPPLPSGARRSCAGAGRLVGVVACAGEAAGGRRVVRRRCLGELVRVAVGVAVGGVVSSSPQAAPARGSSKLRTLVNLVRLRAGVDVLYERLTTGQLDYFQEGVKLLARDTEVRKTGGMVADALDELGLQQRVKGAQGLAETVAYNMAQIVEYDGWDKMNKEEINEKFQAMTPEKVEFATKGLSAVKRDLRQLLALFPPEEVRIAEGVYREVYLGIKPSNEADDEVDGGFPSF